jgi:hypothetical protein
MTESIMWRRLDLPGHEIARLESLDGGWKLSGTTVFGDAQGLSRLDYLVICDAAWRTIYARVTGGTGNREIDLSVSADADRRWRLNGVQCPAVEGCMDIDLGFSPSTNLLPIRRLKLGLDEEAVVTAVWLPFPSLSFELLPQVYRREGERKYRYESGGGTFVRNAAGFVTSYPGLWQAESVG